MQITRGNSVIYSTYWFEVALPELAYKALQNFCFLSLQRPHKGDLHRLTVILHWVRGSFFKSRKEVAMASPKVTTPREALRSGVRMNCGLAFFFFFFLTIISNVPVTSCQHLILQCYTSHSCSLINHYFKFFFMVILQRIQIISIHTICSVKWG